MAGACRDCEKCTEIGAVGATKKVANAGLIIGTLGMSVVGSKMAGAFRKKCPTCGHPMSQHKMVEGRFQD